MPKLKRSDLDVWDNVDQIRLIDAAHLWIGATPTDNETMIGYQVHSVREMLISAVIELEMNSASSEPQPTDRFTKADYRRIAEKSGERPTFLYPEDRRRRTGRKLATVGLYRNCYEEILKVKKAKQCTQTRAAQIVSRRFEIPASAVERNFRRHRETLEKSARTRK